MKQLERTFLSGSMHRALLCVLSLGAVLPGAAASASEPEPAPGKVLAQVMVLVNDHYFDPSRIRPDQMVSSGCLALETATRGAISVASGNGRLILRAGGDEHPVNLADAGSIWKAAFLLRDALQFAVAHAPAGASASELEAALVNGALTTLDPNSVVYTPEIYARLRETSSGSYAGSGAIIRFHHGDDYPRVEAFTRAREATPAQRAGVLIGDQIAAVEGVSTRGKTADEVARMIRGAPGTVATLDLLRNAAPIRVQVTRGSIAMRSEDATLLEGGIGYLRVYMLNGSAASDVTQDLARLQAANGGALKGLVLDLRDNPGGLLEQAVKIADLFVADGVLMTVDGQGGKTHESRRATPGDAGEALPLVVLVNQGTASGAEVVASALKVNDRAVVLGERTHGKGTVQVLYDLPGGAALKLSIARYGGSGGFAEVGMVPDIALQATDATPERSRDWLREPTERPQAELQYVPSAGDPNRLAADAPAAFARDLLRESPFAARSALLSAAVQLALARARQGPLPSPEGSGMALAAKPSVTSAAAGKSNADSAPAPAAPGADEVDHAPVTKMNQPDAWAVVVGVEHYRADLPAADYAENDARVFAQYLSRTLGVPSDHVRLLLGDHASKSDIEEALQSWLPAHANRQGGTAYFYFSGHGAPDPATGEGYLVPWDAEPSSLKSRGLALDEVYASLGKLKGQRVLALLDACFSGSGPRSLLSKGLRPLVPVRVPSLHGGTLAVLSAAGASEVTGPAAGARHGLFTYHLLRGLGGLADQDGDHAISLHELERFTALQVRNDAERQNREQHPQLLLHGVQNPGAWTVVDGLVDP